MKKIICFVGCMDVGGAETFLMKIFRTMDRSKYCMDFIVSREGVYDNEILSLGGHIYIVPLKSEKTKEYIKQTYRILKKNKYDAAMVMSFCSHNTIDLIIARMAGVKKLVMRSTNAPRRDTISKKLQFMNKTLSFLPKNIPNVKIGPSKLAAEYLFGEETVDGGEVTVLNNGLDINEFCFSQDIRDYYRKTLGIQNKFVIGHVGRFNYQKNHDFLVDVFYEVQKERDDAILLLVGTGELQVEIKNKAMNLDIDDKIIFLGVRKDVNNLLNAFDVFLFSSFFEGMPNTVIEAQTNGLPCLISDSITEEAIVTDIVHMKSLKCSATEWKNSLLSLYESTSDFDRIEYAEEMKAAGYDIKDVANNFIKLVF